MFRVRSGSHCAEAAGVGLRVCGYVGMWGGMLCYLGVCYSGSWDFPYQLSWKKRVMKSMEQEID